MPAICCSRRQSPGKSPDIPRDVDALVARMLAKRPGDRI
jgi:hypothetical protein